MNDEIKALLALDKQPLRWQEVEFIEAMEKYQQQHGRPVPTWSEVLQVFFSLGYRRLTEKQSRSSADQIAELERQLADLRAERDRVHHQLADLQARRETHRIAASLTTREDFFFDEEEVLRNATGHSLRELIAEFEEEVQRSDSNPSE